MSGRRMSVNLKKIKGNTQVNHLVQEYGRTPETADRYDDGHRMIDTSRTADNVVLLAPPDNYDRIRRSGSRKSTSGGQDGRTIHSKLGTNGERCLRRANYRLRRAVTPSRPAS